MKSMREQLQELKPKVATTATAPKGKARGSKPSEDEAAVAHAWKSGVTPLANKHRRQEVDKQQPVPLHRDKQSAGATSLRPSAARADAGVRSDSPREGSIVDRRSELPVVKRTRSATPSEPYSAKPNTKAAAPAHAGARKGSGQTSSKKESTTPDDPLAGRLLALTEPSHFKPPEPWLELGRHLQPPDGGNGRNLSVVVGVDFGTAFTKLAIRFADKVHLVTWEGISGAPNPFFLPGEVSRVADGYIFVGRAKHAVDAWAGIKQPFLKPDPSAEARATATAFLAWVFRYARAWVFKNHGALTKNRRLAWNVAVGCPTDAAQDRILVHTYQQIAAAAWLLSRSPDGCSLKTADRALDVMKSPTADAAQLDSLAIVPEFVAQIAGYARSAQRQRGLHFLVDVGAGTLDLATFNVERDQTEDHRDHYAILFSAVELLGTHFLMEARRAAIGGALSWSDTGLTPDTAALGKELPKFAEVIQSADARFEETVCARIRRVVEITKGRRSPHSSVWHEGLPIFVSGGGASCDLYRRAINEACRRTSVRPILLPLGLGEDVAKSKLSETDQHRVSVAYGLTSDASILARITASSQIPDFVLRRTRRPRPDHEALYPR